MTRTIDTTDPVALRVEAERRQRLRDAGAASFDVPDAAGSGASVQTSAPGQAGVLEKQEQAAVVKLFRAYGGTVYSLSQARAAKVTPGLPDLWVVFTRVPAAFWFETKRQVGGKLSPAQRTFAAECHVTGIPHHVGDRRAAARLLIDLGLARVGDGPCGIIPFHHTPRLTP